MDPSHHSQPSKSQYYDSAFTGLLTDCASGDRKLAGVTNAAEIVDSTSDFRPINWEMPPSKAILSPHQVPMLEEMGRLSLEDSDAD